MCFVSDDNSEVTNIGFSDKPDFQYFFFFCKRKNEGQKNKAPEY